MKKKTIVRGLKEGGKKKRKWKVKSKVVYTPEVPVRLKLGKLGGEKVGKGVGWKVGHFTDWSLVPPKLKVNGDLPRKMNKRLKYESQ